MTAASDRLLSRPPVRVFAAAFAASLAFSSAFAWTPGTLRRIADDAVRLMPPALARTLGRHRADLQRGLLEPPPEARAPDATLRDASLLSGQMLAASSAVVRHRPMRQVSYEVGRLCRIVAGMNDPARTAGSSCPGESSAEEAAEFALYAEGVASRAPLVFYGWRDPLPSERDASALAAEIADRSARNAADLCRAFHPGGPGVERVSSAEFDDRSIPFAVAAISYSRAVSDTANLLLAIWKEAGGDASGTPYARTGGAD